MNIGLIPTFKAVISHPPVDGVEALSVVAVAHKRIGDTCASGNDIVMILTDPVRVDALAIRHIAAHIRVVQHTIDGEDTARLVARTPEGEFDVVPISTANTANNGFPSADALLAHHLKLFAAIYQRELRVKETAVVLPHQVGTVLGFATAGRHHEFRAPTLAKRLKVSTESRIIDRRQREQVTATLVIRGHRGKPARLVAEAQALLPSIVGAERHELPKLVGEELARRMKPRQVQAILAAFAVTHRVGMLQLEADGSMPGAFRTEVMRVMGMPAHTANKRQADLVREAMEVVIHGQFQVSPVNGGPDEFIPLMARTKFTGHPDDGIQSPLALIVNPALMGDVAKGRTWRFPEAMLHEFTDDRDGMKTLMALGLGFRLAMGTKGTHEALERFLRRSGCHEAVMALAAKEGMPHAMKRLRGILDDLRAKPWDGQRVDVIGGIRIEGASIDKARLIYEAPPSWAVSSA